MMIEELAWMRRLGPAGRRALRQAAGVTQAEIAAEVGVSRAAVCRWESGKRTPRGGPARTYARLLRTLAGLTGGDGR